MLSAYLIAQAALNLGILIIQIIKLYLNHLNLRIFRQDLIQHLCRIMKGHTHMAYFPFLFKLKGSFICPAGFKMGEVSGTLRMHQIKIKIVYATGLQLTLKKGPDILFLLKIITRKLIGENILFPRITTGQTFPDRKLTFSLNISMRCIKIVKTFL